MRRGENTQKTHNTASTTKCYSNNLEEALDALCLRNNWRWGGGYPRPCGFWSETRALINAIDMRHLLTCVDGGGRVTLISRACRVLSEGRVDVYLNSIRDS